MSDIYIDQQSAISYQQTHKQNIKQLQGQHNSVTSPREEKDKGMNDWNISG